MTPVGEVGEPKNNSQLEVWPEVNGAEVYSVDRLCTQYLQFDPDFLDHSGGSSTPFWHAGKR
jgi:hypothetical protein